MSEFARGMCAAPSFPRHVYVHVPLCSSKCRYCSFCSFPVADDDAKVRDMVADRLRASALAWRDCGLAPPQVVTLYVGGGTPTVLGRGLVRLVRELRRILRVGSDAEVTVEANPDSLTPELARDLAEAGVTRVSVGVQSLDDEVLRFLGRGHDARAARAAMAAVREAGLELAADVICGVPVASDVTWRETIEGVLAAGAGHVSVYPLSIDEGTPLADDVAAGRAEAPDDDRTADDMQEAAAMLEAAGLRRYETANFALPGRESRHNLAYWTGVPYLGIGPGAHGMLTAEQAIAAGLLTDRESEPVARVRYAYRGDAPVQPAIARPSDGATVELLSPHEAAREDAMLGMRRAEGITHALAERAGVARVMRELERDGLVEQRARRWRPTERGWLLGNEVFRRIWSCDAV